MARPVIPFAVHQARGTARAYVKRRHAVELKLPPGSVGAAPRWLSVESRAEWKRLTNDPDYRKVLSPAHRGALVEYSILFGRMVEDARNLRQMTASERQTLNSLRMQLGITPASQSKVRAPKSEKPANKWADVG